MIYPWERTCIMFLYWYQETCMFFIIIFTKVSIIRALAKVLNFISPEVCQPKSEILITVYKNPIIYPRNKVAGEICGDQFIFSYFIVSKLKDFSTFYSTSTENCTFQLTFRVGFYNITLQTKG